MNIKRIFVDMDGVLADFIQGCSAMIGEPLTPDNNGHMIYDQRKLELTNKRLFRNLPPMGLLTENWLFTTKMSGSNSGSVLML